MSLDNYSKLRSIKTPLACTVFAHLIVVALGLFCVLVARVLLTFENLPTRYKDLAFLGQVLYYVGFVIVVLALGDLLRILFRLWKNNKSQK